MKFIYTLIFSLTLLPTLTFAQRETLLDIDNFESGGYGGPLVKFSPIKKELGVFAGGYGGWLINHTFMIGAGGYGLVNKIKADESIQVDNTNPLYLQVGYGGVVFEYISNQEKLIHYTITSLIGGGNVKYAFFDNFDFNNYGENSFFVTELGINAELNVIAYCKMFMGGSYRFVSGIDLKGLKNSDLSGLSLNLGFKFGSF